MRHPDVRSLRFRILALAAASIGMTLLIAGVTLVLIFERHIHRRLASELVVRWVDIAGLLERDDTGEIRLVRTPSDPRYEQPLSGAYWQVVVDGQPVARSRSLWDEAIPLPPGRPLDGTPFDAPGIAGGADFYVVTREVELGPAGEPVRAEVSVAVDHREFDALSRSFSADLVLAFGAIAAALFAGAWAQASVGLAPLRRLGNAIQDVRSGRRPRLGAAYPSEVQPLAEDLDRLLDRHEQTLRKARDRAGSLAHGLKTPLTILTLEARKLAESGQRAAAESVAAQVEAMRGHVQRELARARIRGATREGGPLGVGAVPVGRTVAKLVDLVRRMPYAEDLQFRLECPDDLAVRMEVDDFGEVIGNLLDNARKWARREVIVRASAAEEGTALLEVLDDGPGFGQEGGRPRDAEGSGLGLSIVGEILEEYGSSLATGRSGGYTAASFSVEVAPPEEVGWPPAGLPAADAAK